MNWEGFGGGALAAAIAGLIYFLFGQIGARLGWSREDNKEAGKRIERVDQTARAEIARLEGEVKRMLASQDRKLARLEENVRHLPTTSSIMELGAELHESRRETARLAAAQEAQAQTTKTILDYLMSKEPR